MLQVEKDAEQLHEQEFEIERLQTEVVELRARLDDAIAGSEDSAAALSDQSAAIKAKNNKLLALSNKLKEMQQAAASAVHETEQERSSIETLEAQLANERKDAKLAKSQVRDIPAIDATRKVHRELATHSLGHIVPRVDRTANQ